MKISGLIILFFFSFTLYAGEVVSSESINRGSGFSELKTVEKQAGSSDKTSRHKYLFHKTRKLSKVSKYSISPSGSYAAYVSEPVGNIVLYSSSDGQVTVLTKKFIAPVKKFLWNETFEMLEVSFSDKTPSQNFALE